MINRFTYKQPILVFRVAEAVPHSLDRLAVNNLTELIKALPKYIPFFKKYYEDYLQHRTITIPDEVTLPEDIVNEGWTLSRKHKNRDLALERKTKVVQLGKADFGVDYGAHSYFFDKEMWFDEFTPSKHPHDTRVSTLEAPSIVEAITRTDLPLGCSGFLLTLGVPKDAEHNYGSQKVTSLREMIDLIRAGADL